MKYNGPWALLLRKRVKKCICNIGNVKGCTVLDKMGGIPLALATSKRTYFRPISDVFEGRVVR